MKKLHATLSAAGFLGMLNATAPAEEITLNNGAVISGMILSETDEMVRLNRHGQEIQFRRENIATIDRSSLTYYDEEFQQAASHADEARLKRLFNAMRVHKNQGIRDHGAALEERYGQLSAETVYKGENLSKLSLPQLRSLFRESADRLRWSETIFYGNELLRRGERDATFESTLLEAFRAARQQTHFLLMDVFRLLDQTNMEDMRVSQVYQLSAIEQRMLELWNPDRPTRTDSEVNALMIVRGLLINLDKIAPENSRYRGAAEDTIKTFIMAESWDRAIAEIEDLYTLLIFANASRASTELTPLFRYFALLKEPDILKADTSDPLLADSVREARGVYVYTVSGIVPLPKEKLWSSARDLAIIGSTKAPTVSEIIAEVFQYTPQSRHLDLSMAYEDLLVPEALRGLDKGKGLGHGLRYIATARSGNEFERTRSWTAYEALATFLSPSGEDGTTPMPSTSAIMDAMFSVTSAFEQEKICLLYDSRLINAALKGTDNGDGLRCAVTLVASRRAGDTSKPREKWNAFRALASLNRLSAGLDPTAPMSTSDILQAAFTVCPEQSQLRLCMLFEENLAEAAMNPLEHGSSLLKSIRMIARQRADDLTDAGASWRAFNALAAVSNDYAALPGATIEPPVEDVFATVFHEVQDERHGDIAARFEDRLVNAVVAGSERGPGLDRAARSLSLQRLRNPADPIGGWRAFELMAVLETGHKVSSSQVMDVMDRTAGDSVFLLGNALKIAASRYSESERGSNLIYNNYKRQWSERLLEGMTAWVNGTARLQGLPKEIPVMPDIALAEIPELKQKQLQVNEHARLLRDLQSTETRLKERYRSAVDNISDGRLRTIAMELNGLWDRTQSPAARERIRTLVEEAFDRQTQSALIANGLKVAY